MFVSYGHRLITVTWILIQRRFDFRIFIIFCYVICGLDFNIKNLDHLFWKRLKLTVWGPLLLRSEILSGMCAKLRTAAASNNRDRDHPTRSHSSSPLASTINCSPGSQALLEVTHQDHSIVACSGHIHTAVIASCKHYIKP